MGGVLEAWAANFDDVASVTVTDDIVKTIAMNAEAKFKHYLFRPNTASMTSTLTTDDTNGTSYVTTELSLRFARMDTAKRVEIAALTQASTVWIVKDRNGVYWYLGQQQGLRPSAGTGSTGTAAGDANEYAITVSGDSETFPLEVDAGALADITD